MLGLNDHLTYKSTFYTQVYCSHCKLAGDRAEQRCKYFLLSFVLISGATGLEYINRNEKGMVNLKINF